jgi:hypothetical protein
MGTDQQGRVFYGKSKGRHGKGYFFALLFSPFGKGKKIQPCTKGLFNYDSTLVFSTIIVLDQSNAGLIAPCNHFK